MAPAVDPEAGQTAWRNPMLEAFLDEANSYPNVAPAQQPYARFRRQVAAAQGQEQDEEDEFELAAKPVKLWVGNIQKLNETGLRNLFGRYGRVVEAFAINPRKPGDSRFAFVSMSNHQEAAAAKAHLDGGGALNLKVNYAHDDKLSSNEGLDEIEEEEEEEEAKELSESEPEVPSRGSKLAALHAAAAHRPLRQPKVHTRENLWHQAPELSFSSGEEHSKKADSPDTGSKAEQRLKEFQKPADPALLRPKQFGYPLLLPYAPPETCVYGECQNMGKMRCSRCWAWYCSLTCQIADWPVHEAKCVPRTPDPEPEPEIKGDPDSRAASPLSENEKTKKEDEIPAIKRMEKVLVDSGVLAKDEQEPEVKNETSEDSSKSGTKAKACLDKLKALRKGGSDKKQSEEPEEPKEKTLKDHKVMTSTLHSAKVGDQLTIFTDSSLPDFDPARFNAMEIGNEDVFTYVVDELQDKLASLKPKPLTSVQAGDLVMALEDGDAYARAVVLEVFDKEAIVFLPDRADNLLIEVENLLPMPEEAKEVQSTGVVVVAADLWSPELKDVLLNMLEEQVYVKITEVRSTKAGDVDSLFGTINGEDGDIAQVVLYPWTVNDQRVEKLLGITRPKLTLENLGSQIGLEDGTEVMYACVGKTTDKVVVQTVAALESKVSDKIDSLLNQELFRMSFLVENPVKGQIVASKWYDDLGDGEGCSGRYYRAEVTAVDKIRKRVRVTYIDYGNRSVEPFRSLVHLPECVHDFPPTAHFLQLKGVPSLTSDSNAVKVRVMHLAPHFEVPFKVKKCEDDETTDLVHPNGKMISTMLAVKLSEPSEPLGDMEGKVPGGGFSYDSCPMAELSVRPEDQPQEGYILHAQSPNEMYICPASHIHLIAELERSIKAYIGSRRGLRSGGHTPNIGQVCLARSKEDKTWYRAVAISQLTFEDGTEGAHVVFFPDYGFTDILGKDKLQIIPDELMRFPFLANMCHLSDFVGMDEFPEDLKMDELFSDFEKVKINVLENAEGNLKIEIPEKAKEIESFKEKLASA